MKIDTGYTWSDLIQLGDQFAPGAKVYVIVKGGTRLEKLTEVMSAEMPGEQWEQRVLLWGR